jgi:hypothetical protein
MKKSLLLLTLFVSIFMLGAYAEKKGTITVKTSYTGIVEGYDHVNKTVLYVDGKLAAESSEQVQSKPNSFSVTVPWEEHTIANEYSLDALYEGSVNVKKKLTVNLVFDIDQEKTLAKVK